MDTICIVNDGQTSWGARWDALRAALERLGWTQDRTMWSEPEGDSLSRYGHYGALCSAVPLADGYAPGDFPRDVPGCATLIFRPDLDGRWEFSPNSEGDATMREDEAVQLVKSIHAAEANELWELAESLRQSLDEINKSLAELGFAPIEAQRQDDWRGRRSNL